MVERGSATTSGRSNVEPREEAGRAPSRTNVGRPERVLSAVGGGALALFALARRSPLSLALAPVGGYLLYRGATAHCAVYDALGISTATTASLGRSPVASVGHGQGIRVEKTVTIEKSPEELYSFWRNFENLPRIMNHLEAVRTLDGKRSHWVAKAPLGTSVEWDAEIINEEANELIGWRSLEGATVPNAGSVRFRPAPGGRGTEVTVNLEYDPPAGKLGAAFAKLFGEEPQQQVEEGLRRLKQLMEAGEIPTTAGQPKGK